MLSPNNRWLYLIFSLQIAFYGLLCLVSLGSGWSYPRILPDKFDSQVWISSDAINSELLSAVIYSLIVGGTVGTISTAAGLLIAQQSWYAMSRICHWGAILPFALSPVIIGICLLDLQMRLGISGTLGGVLLAQSCSGTSFAVIFFSQAFSKEFYRQKELVRSLGGNTFQVLKHAIIPKAKGFICLCWIQTALFAWLDYGYVSILGGGQIKTLTVLLFTSIREGSINIAAQSSLILMTPAFIGSVAVLLFGKGVRE